MDIPKDYEMCDIDKRILKPAIKELTAEQNLFDFGKRTPFKNLKYTKLDKNKKENPRGRNKVCYIRFDFKHEQIQELESQTEKAKPTNTKEPNLDLNLDLYVSKLISTEFGNARILNVEKHNNTFINSHTCCITYSLWK